MECQRCLEENKISIAEKGYGYGYIGETLNCVRHNKPHGISAHLPGENKLIRSGIGNIESIKWTDGQPYERTRRMNHQIQIENNEFSKKMETTAYSSSLNHDENTWEILNQSLGNSTFKVSNKREELGDKLANREMIQQIGFNPFLSETNYVDDISIRDKFLKPINTNEEDKN